MKTRVIPQARCMMSPLLSALSGAILLIAAFIATGAPIPVADFVRQNQFRNPSLAPDGRHLVVTQLTQQDGKDLPLIIIYDLDTMKVTATVRMPIFEVATDYVWISDTRLVVSVGRDQGTLEPPAPTGEILAMDVDGGHQQYLYGRDMFKRSKRGPSVGDDKGFGWTVHVPDAMDGHFFLTEHLWSWTAKPSSTRLLDINSNTGARKQVTEIEQEGFDFLVQGDGVPRFAYGDDERAYLSVFKFDDTTREWQSLTGSDESNLLPLALTSDRGSFFASVSTQGGTRSLVRQSGDSGERLVLVDAEIGNIDEIEYGPRPQTPFAGGTHIGIPKLRYFDEQRSEAQLHKLLSSTFPGMYVHFVNFSTNGDKLLFEVSSDRDPGVFYLFERATGKASLLFANMSWINPEQMAEKRPIQFKSRDGLQIHGYLTLPFKHDEVKVPLVLLPHGGPHGISDDWFFDSDVQFLASRGYAVLQINYRGSGGRGPAFQAAGYRHWGDRIQDDLIDGVRWTIEQGAVDPARVCVYGGSFGAYSAMMTAIRAPELIKCAIGYSGLYDLGLVYEKDEVKIDKRFLNYFIKAIGQDATELARNSPSRQAAKINAPVLLVHGSADKNTLPIQAETMRDALKKAGKPPEWMFVEDEGHGFRSEKNRKDFYERMEAFLNKHIGPK